MRGYTDGSKEVPSPRNAFHPSFLKKIGEQDEPPFAAEAEAAGPWHIEEHLEHGFGLFRPGESYAGGFRPVAVCKAPWLARLLAAVLPATGRDPEFRLRPEADQLGFAIESRADFGEPVAWLALFDDNIPPALHLALCLARSPESLKLLLAAAGGVALEVTGGGAGRDGYGEVRRGKLKSWLGVPAGRMPALPAGTWGFLELPAAIAAEAAITCTKPAANAGSAGALLPRSRCTLACQL